MLYYLIASATPRSRRLAERLRRELPRYGYSPLHESELGSSDLSSTIPKVISSVDVVLADVSGAEPGAPDIRPDIFFELGLAFGYARSQRKPIIPLIDQTSSIAVPSSLTGSLYIPYKGPDDPDLVERIAKLAKSSEGLYAG